jgi:Cytochrome c554 and c-prime
MIFHMRLRYLLSAMLCLWSMLACFFVLRADPDATKNADNVPAPSKFNKTGKTKDGEKSAELFVDWPKPELAIVFTGNQFGYVEPCGCTGLENQKGGLARRHTFLQALGTKGWDVLSLDAGNQVRRFGVQPNLQFQFTANALKHMNYKAIGLGLDDLRLSTGELFVEVGNLNGDSPFVSANVALLDRTQLSQYKIVTIGKIKLAITSVLGSEHLKKLAGEDILTQAPVAALTEIMPKIAAEKPQVSILMTYASEEETKAIAKKFPQFSLVCMATTSGEPSFEPETIGPNTLLVRSGAKGMYAVVIGLFNNPQQPVRYERVPLDSRFQDSQDMLSMMANYQNSLKNLGLTGLGVKPLPHVARHRFVGTKTCGECHTKAMEVWEKTPHAHATDSIIHPKERGSIARHFDPECLSCHVTGWEPQKFHPFFGGYTDLETTAHMKQNGCENCHGPGSEHVLAENDDGTTYKKEDVLKLRQEMQISLAKRPGEDKSPAEQRCMECHDIDNSPDFHEKGAFEKYWKEVEHKGKD